jgi:hypothetical protein
LRFSGMNFHHGKTHGFEEFRVQASQACGDEKNNDFKILDDIIKECKNNMK